MHPGAAVDVAGPVRPPIVRRLLRQRRRESGPVFPADGGGVPDVPLVVVATRAQAHHPRLVDGASCGESRQFDAGAGGHVCDDVTIQGAVSDGDDASAAYAAAVRLIKLAELVAAGII